MSISALLIAAMMSYNLAYHDKPPTLCAPLDVTMEFITRVWGEKFVGHMIEADTGNRYEAFVNPETGTWTILAISDHATTACIADAGIFNLKKK